MSTRTAAQTKCVPLCPPLQNTTCLRLLGWQQPQAEFGYPKPSRVQLRSHSSPPGPLSCTCLALHLSHHTSQWCDTKTHTLSSHCDSKTEKQDTAAMSRADYKPLRGSGPSQTQALHLGPPWWRTPRAFTHETAFHILVQRHRQISHTKTHKT